MYNIVFQLVESKWWQIFIIRLNNTPSHVTFIPSEIIKNDKDGNF